MRKSKIELATETFVESVKKFAKEIVEIETEKTNEEDNDLKPGTIVKDEHQGYDILRGRKKDSDGIFGKAYYVTNGCSSETWLGEEQFEVITPIKGAAKEGDMIIITDVHMISIDDYEEGDVMTVERVDLDGTVRKTDKHSGLIARFEYEIVERPEEKKDPRDKFKKGDNVRLLNGGRVFPLFGFHNEEIYEVKETKIDKHTPGVSLIKIGTPFKQGYATADQLELITDDEDKRRKDEVRVGDIVRVLEYCGGKPVGSIFEVKKIGRHVHDENGKVYGALGGKLGSDIEMVATVEELAELKRKRK